jgi:ribonucleotide monophosphatase NagD (HAD superfamily)
LNISVDKFPQIDALFQLTDVVKWEKSIQLFSDLLISNNGMPGSVRELSEKQYVDFHIASLDLLYKDDFPVPRMAAGSFYYSLEHLFYMKYKRRISFVEYGKPNQRIFNYASKIILLNSRGTY